MKKALVYASVASMVDQFNMENICILKKLGYEVNVACNFEVGSTYSSKRTREFKRELESMGVRTFHIPVPRKVTAITELINAFKQTKNLFSQNQYDIVHCHSPIGGVIARVVGRRYRKKGMKVIYTAHGFHFYKGAPLKNWLLFYTAELLLARYTDTLITINKEDYSRAKKINSKKSKYIPGVGLDTNSYKNIVVDKKTKFSELGITNMTTLLVSVGELNNNKNHEVVIKALAKLNMSNVVYIICGKGSDKRYLIDLADELNISNQVKLLGFRSDVKEIMKVADIFIFPSFREGLSLSLMEAMALGLPVICSNIRGNTDLIKNGKGGYLIAPSDINGITETLTKLINNYELASQMGGFNSKEIKKYDKLNVNKLMKEIYQNI